MMTDTLPRDLILADDDTFSQSEAPRVCRDFVCAVCHAELLLFFIPGDFRVMIACPAHGNVTGCGRVTRNTVNIENERASRLFKVVIKNLPDLWGNLDQPVEARPVPEYHEIATPVSDLSWQMWMEEIAQAEAIGQKHRIVDREAISDNDLIAYIRELHAQIRIKKGKA